MLRKDLADILRSPSPPTHRLARAHLSPSLSQTDFIRNFTEAVTQVHEVFIGETAPPPLPEDHEFPSDKGWLCIQTGGSSGNPKWACHDQETILAAVNGYAKHFDTPRINATGVLPMHHISGLMAWLRCVLTGGHYQPTLWSDIQAGRLPDISTKHPPFLSLVPTQLQRLLQAKDSATLDWLRRHQAIHLGGGPSHPDLIEQAAEARLPISLSYGMTETAAMVTASRPHEFASGLRDNGPPLPHVRIDIPETEEVLIYTDSLHHGYYPNHDQQQPFQPKDFGRLSPSGTLTILGRSDDLIITGGEKVNPTEVEHILLNSGQFSDIAVVSLPHSEWGQRIIAVYPAQDIPDILFVKNYLSERLSGYKHPKAYYPFSPWPRSLTGKLNRKKLQKILLQN